MNDPVQVLTDRIADFLCHFSKVLPDDVTAKLRQLSQEETAPLAKTIYETMAKNQALAAQLDRPCCQDTGVLQFWVKCGTEFPLINDLEALLKEATLRATFAAPLRHNSVETFDEYNTKRNVGTGTPTVWWDIVPHWDGCEIYTYMAGGGCTLPGRAMVLMPGAGYEGVTDFVLDQMTSYGLNACPPLLVGVGVGTSIDAAHRLPQSQRQRRQNGASPGGRHQRHRPGAPGPGGQGLRAGGPYRKHRTAPLRHRRGRERGLLVPSPGPSDGGERPERHLRHPFQLALRGKGGENSWLNCETAKKC